MHIPRADKSKWLYLGGQKKTSAKGVTAYAQKALNHDLYKEVLELKAEEVRQDNPRIVSKDHVLYTVNSRKVCLSAYDDKRFIRENGIDTTAYGHYSIRDIPFIRQITRDDDFRESTTSPQTTQLPPTANTTIIQTETTIPPWEPPDPGFHQEPVHDSDFDLDLVDFDESFSEPSPPPCPFINDQAVESGEDEENNDDSTADSSDEEIIITRRPAKRRRIQYMTSSDDDL